MKIETEPRYKRLARGVRRRPKLHTCITLAFLWICGPAYAVAYLVGTALADKPPPGADKVLEQGKDIFHWLNGDDQ